LAATFALLAMGVLAIWWGEESADKMIAATVVEPWGAQGDEYLVRFVAPVSGYVRVGLTLEEGATSPQVGALGSSDRYWETTVEQAGHPVLTESINLSFHRGADDLWSAGLVGFESRKGRSYDVTVRSRESASSFTPLPSEISVGYWSPGEHSIFWGLVGLYFLGAGALLGAVVIAALGVGWLWRRRRRI